ncbi:MAG TPA: GNAT family N-acetyltransferase [Actinokineospora sp.]|nr:GNAT family N-acetyltransferase [Actinokineospora sp.]
MRTAGTRALTRAPGRRPESDRVRRAWAPDFTSLERSWAQRARVHLAADGTHTWVAEGDTAVAGFAGVRVDHAESMGEIYMIAVDPAHQRHGIGAALIAHSLARIKSQGMALAMVDIGGDPGRAPARRTCEQAGFTLLPIARYFKRL